MLTIGVFPVGFQAEGGFLQAEAVFPQTGSIGLPP
jgi:hypothetical protein